MKYELVATADCQRALHPHLSSLFHECYGKPLPSDQWDHLYLSSPGGPALSATAWDDGELIGHYAIARYPIIDANGNRTWIGRGMTLAIAEKGRGFGVFGELLRLIRSAMVEHDLTTTIGFPNDLSWRPLVLFGGWRILRESTMRLHPRSESNASPSIRRECTLPPGLRTPPYDDADFLAWRGRKSPIETYAVNDRVAVVAKRWDGDTLDVMDAWSIQERADGTEVGSLARHLGLSRVCITDHHAGLVGIDPDKGTPVGSAVRLGIMTSDAGAPIEPRFSLLLSDVY